jgi:hypothetical protein
MAMTRNSTTIVCATWQGRFPVGSTRSAPSRVFPSSRHNLANRKHELAESHLPKDRNFCGLFLVIKGIAPAPVWEVKRNADGQITEIRHRKNWPYVKHFYFRLIDPEWGHVSIRMCSYPPFGAQVILNGHELVERQAWRKKVVTVKDGNCFVEGSDFPGIDRLAAELL